MQVLTGRNELRDLDLQSMIGQYREVEIELGCGDGRRLYRLAGRRPDTLYIGIDPAAANLFDTASRAARPARKGGRDNLLLVAAAVEYLPPDLSGTADRITIILPWGALLVGLLKAEEKILAGIAGLADRENGADFAAWLSCSQLLEAGEMERRELPALSEGLFLEVLRPLYAGQGLFINQVGSVGQAELRGLDSSWAKRLAENPRREVFSLSGCIKSRA